MVRLFCNICALMGSRQNDVVRRRAAVVTVLNGDSFRITTMEIYFFKRLTNYFYFPRQLLRDARQMTNGVV